METLLKRQPAGFEHAAILTDLDGVTLGSNVVVGANGVVTSNLPDGAIAAGVPARVLRTREKPSES